jgi:hypothetical protein
MTRVMCARSMTAVVDALSAALRRGTGHPIPKITAMELDRSP